VKTVTTTKIKHLEKTKITQNILCQYLSHTKTPWKNISLATVHQRIEINIQSDRYGRYTSHSYM
jgi:hypothetical protein